MKGKIKRNIESQKESKREKDKEEFALRYNDLEEIAFTDGDNFNYAQMERFLNSFRVIPKNILSYGLSKAALAVYPVLCSRADFREDKSFQISQKNIALLAGVSENAVREASDELIEAEFVTRKMETEGTRHFYIYEVAFIRKSMLEDKEYHGDTIYFYTYIIDNGIWAKLKPRAKALYLAMRAAAKQDLEEYSYWEGNETGECYELIEYDEYIRNRKWDICFLSLAKLCKLANIERTNINPILEELERYSLIERMGEWTKVYLKPRRLLKY